RQDDDVAEGGGVRYGPGAIARKTTARLLVGIAHAESYVVPLCLEEPAQRAANVPRSDDAHAHSVCPRDREVRGVRQPWSEVFAPCDETSRSGRAPQLRKRLT